MTQSRWLIVGDGWSALALASILAETEAQVTWLTAQGSRVIAPISVISREASTFLAQLCSTYAIDAGSFQPGWFLREFRNKAFREAEIEEGMWGPESVFFQTEEGALSKDLYRIENELREKLLTRFEANPDRLKRIVGNPIHEIKSEEGKVTEVILGSGESLTFDHAVYADRWSALPAIQGLPKPISFMKGRESFGVLQAIFQHDLDLGIGLNESFYGAQTKDAGDDVHRNVMGYFTTAGDQSIWTTFLTSEEVEDNHMIAKRLRKMKQALNKMFEARLTGLGQSKAFAETVKDEQVRFEEAAVFGSGEKIISPVSHSKLQGLDFLTDGYGVTSSLLQVKALVSSFYQPRAHAETEAVNFDHAETTQAL